MTKEKLNTRDISIPQIASHTSRGEILTFELRKPIIKIGVGGRFDAVEPRRVHAENRALHFAGCCAQRRETVLALHVHGDLQAAQALDLPLRRAGPYRIGPP